MGAMGFAEDLEAILNGTKTLAGRFPSGSRGREGPALLVWPLGALVGSGLFAAENLGPISSSGEAIGVSGAMLAVAILGNLMLGALMTMGIGLYAPCMLLVASMGMNERTRSLEAQGTFDRGLALNAYNVGNQQRPPADDPSSSPW